VELDHDQLHLITVAGINLLPREALGRIRMGRRWCTITTARGHLFGLVWCPAAMTDLSVMLHEQGWPVSAATGVGPSHSG
jgi:hypothetical protein